MNEQGATQQADSILLPFLRAADEEESKRLLEQIVFKHADNIIKGVIRSEMRVSLDGAGRSNSDGNEVEDARDAYCEIVEKLVKRLQELKSHSGGESIADFPNYVGSIARNACCDFLRRKYPLRRKLKNKLRYLLLHREDFALWGSKTEELLCGLDSWKKIERAVGWAGVLNRVELSASEASAMDMAELLTAIFKQVGSPMRFEDLVSLTADLLGIKDQADSTEFIEVEDNSAIAERIEQQFYLKLLWAQICKLSLSQRIALLLNLRDEGGVGLALFIQIGLTSIRKIAELLEMPAEQFAVLWNALPIDDAAIAKLLSVTKQQVTYFRRTARACLVQNMKGL